MLQVNHIRDLHLFDVFDEICEPDEQYDGERAITEAGGLEFSQGRMNSVKGIYNNPILGGSGNIDDVRQLLVRQIQFPQKNLHIHQGWFQDTIPKVAPKISSIAMLRLDADLYASTKIAMEYLYPKLANKGIIIIDDYGAYEGCKKAIDDYLKNNELYPFICHLDHECIYWIK